MLQKLYLIEPTTGDADAAEDLMVKWRAYGGRINPGLLRRLGKNYTQWLKEIRNAADEILCEANDIPQTLYWLKSAEDKIIGAVSLRHYLNESNIVDGGHVGYGIAPEFRGRGYGNEILRLAVEKLNEMNIKKILVTCDADNYISQHVILHNGGILENQMNDEDGVLVNRYWIDLP